MHNAVKVKVKVNWLRLGINLRLRLSFGGFKGPVKAFLFIYIFFYRVIKC